MIIRSQDGEIIEVFNNARYNFVINQKHTIITFIDNGRDYEVLGYYNSKKEAIKALDSLHFAISHLFTTFQFPQSTKDITA